MSLPEDDEPMMPLPEGTIASMGGKRRIMRPWHVTALQLALEGASPEVIAKRLTQPLRTVKRLMQSDWAQRELTCFQRAVMSRIEKDRVDPIVRFQRLISRAIDKLEAQLDCGDAKVEHLAACRLLDNAGFSPVKRIAVTEDEQLRGLTLEQMKYVQRTGRIPASQALIEAEVMNGTDETTEALTA